MQKNVIAITGSTGFIASHLMKELKEYEFIKITREDFKREQKELKEKIRDSEAVINLAGAPIIKRWTNRNKKEIFDSRIETTRKIRKAIQKINKPIHLLSGSAIGIYDEKGEHTEASNKYSDGFLYEVIYNWEKEATGENKGILNPTILRIGIVLAKDGGIYRTMRPFFKNSLGGKIGTGKQWMSFIHIVDLVNAIKFIMERNIRGVVNITAPDPVENKKFTQVMAQLMKKPAFLTIPNFALRLIYGEGASVIYTGQKVIPEILIKNGFEYKFPGIEAALMEIIKNKEN